MKRTIIAVKLRAGRKSREVLGLFVGFIGFAAVLAMLGAIKYAVCQRDHPGKTIKACVFPMLPIFLVILLTGCPAEQKVSPTYPPDYQADALERETEEALKAATPNDDNFPFETDGPGCPEEEETEP